MSRYTGPRNKRARKVGEDLGLKTSAVKVARRLASKPGQHGSKGHGKMSGFAIQLKEKQKLKYIYGVTEKQLRGLYDTATQSSSATGEELLALLERRIDNVLYRLGWAPTRAAARQLVNHGHVMVNGTKVSVPSYRVVVSDIITYTTRGLQIPLAAQAVKDETTPPAWLEKKQAVAHVSRLPERADITETVEEQLVVEFYSR